MVSSSERFATDQKGPQRNDRAKSTTASTTAIAMTADPTIILDQVDNGLAQAEPKRHFALDANRA